MRAADSGNCALCERETGLLTRHHLFPRALHQRAWVRRRTSREERHQTIWLCRPCHKQIHALLSETELARSYHTLEQLAAHPGIGEFVAWVRRQPAHADIRVRKRS